MEIFRGERTYNHAEYPARVDCCIGKGIVEAMEWELVNLISFRFFIIPGAALGLLMLFWSYGVLD